MTQVRDQIEFDNFTFDSYRSPTTEGVSFASDARRTGSRCKPAMSDEPEEAEDERPLDSSVAQAPTWIHATRSERAAGLAPNTQPNIKHA